MLSDPRCPHSCVPSAQSPALALGPLCPPQQVQGFEGTTLAEGSGAQGPLAVSGAGKGGAACGPQCPGASPSVRRVSGEQSGQFVFIQNHLRSHSGEMKRERPASRARARRAPRAGGVSAPSPRPPVPQGRMPCGGSRRPSCPLSPRVARLAGVSALSPHHAPGSRAPGGWISPPQPPRRPCARVPLICMGAHSPPICKAAIKRGGRGRPKLAFPRPSGARSGRGWTKGAGRGERRVCRTLTCK